jgi:hypothetical protein
VGERLHLAVLQKAAHFLHRETVELENFVTRLVATNDFNAIAGAVKPVGEQFHQGFVRGSIYRGRGDFDLQFIALRFADFIRRRARLEFDGKQNAIRLIAEKIRHGNYLSSGLTNLKTAAASAAPDRLPTR